jgi:hypothetical protein
MRLPLPSWTPLVLVALLAAAWPVAGLASGGGTPQPAWVHAAEGDPVPHGDPVNAAAGDVASELASVGVTSVGLETAPWRGTERATDNPASTSSGSKIKLVYVYAADQPDRFAQYASLIQTDAKAIAETVAATSGGRKTLRYDTGTDGGAGYVDIASVRLPAARAVYASMNAADRSAAVRAAIAPTVRVNGGVAHYAVYADGLYGNDWVAGIAQMYYDTSKSASNLNNINGLWAFVWGDGSATFSSSHRTTLLHEITHTLGGVQPTAPHGTGYGHCSDVKDVMCYDDGGLKPGQSLVQSCATVQYDCNGEDYFNATPAAGSYLATNWNVYDSAFLCAPASCVSGGPVNVAPEGPIDESGGTTTLPTAPGSDASKTPTTPPADDGAPKRRKPRSRADRAVDALLAAGRRALTRGVPSRLNLSFSSPATGRLRVSLSVGAKRAASVSRRVRSGRTRVVLRVDRRARRSYARGAKASLAVSFAPTRGRSASAHAAVSSRRR